MEEQHYQKKILQLFTDKENQIAPEHLEAFVNLNKRRVEKFKEWIQEWIDKQPDDMSTLKFFLKQTTGAFTASSPIKFMVFNIQSLKGLYSHTCMHIVDTPRDSLPSFKEVVAEGELTDEQKKEALFVLLDRWGTGVDADAFNRG
jgi:hypothetical protein